MTKPYLPTWATVQEAADWLSAHTAENWTPRRVLDAVVQQCIAKVHRHNRAAATQGVPPKDWPPSNPFTELRVAPPPDTEFILHPVPSAPPPVTLLPQLRLPWRLVPLRLAELNQLLLGSAVILKDADGRQGTDANGTPLSIEELRPPVRATFAEVRLPGAYVKTLGPAALEGARIELVAFDGAAPASAEPVPGVVAAAPVVQAVVAASATHRVQRRDNPLAAALTQAKGNALDARSWQSAWAALVALAEQPSRPAPLLGYVEGEGVQYRVDDSEEPVAYLTRDAFRKRFKRAG